MSPENLINEKGNKNVNFYVYKSNLLNLGFCTTIYMLQKDRDY